MQSNHNIICSRYLKTSVVVLFFCDFQLNGELLLVYLTGLIKLTVQSIAGVTYMDRFDFEERYRDVHECDPMHWYPLHLPPECALMYEELIRKSIASTFPIHIVKPKQSTSYSLNPSTFYSTDDYETQYLSDETPYEKMFKLLTKDVKKRPKAPKITVLPGLGVVALYHQPVSRKSGQYIKKMSAAYRDANINYSNQLNYKQVLPSVGFDITNDNEKKTIKNEELQESLKKSDIIAMFKSTL